MAEQPVHSIPDDWELDFMSEARQRSADAPLSAARLHAVTMASLHAAKAAAAGVRKYEWIAAGAAAIFLYLLAVSPPSRPFTPMDVLVLTTIILCTAILVAHEIRVQALMTDLTEAAVAAFRELAPDPARTAAFDPIGNKAERLSLGPGVGRNTGVESGPRRTTEPGHE